jgi:hypothetical protein
MISDDTYDRLKTAFADKPGNIANAAQTAVVNWKTAERAWKKGWANRGYEALEEVHKRNQVKARAEIEVAAAARRASQAKDREDARRNAVDAVKQEGQMVMFARAQSLQSLTVATQLAQMARQLVPELKRKLDLEVRKLEIWAAYETQVIDASQQGLAPPAHPTFARPPMTLQETVMLLQRVSDINGDIVRTAREAMEMERLHLGQPTNLIGVIDETREITMDELQLRLAAATQAIQAGVAAGGLKLVENAPVAPSIGKVVKITSSRSGT